MDRSWAGDFALRRDGFLESESESDDSLLRLFLRLSEPELLEEELDDDDEELDDPLLVESESDESESLSEELELLELESLSLSLSRFLRSFSFSFSTLSATPRLSISRFSSAGAGFPRSLVRLGLDAYAGPEALHS